MHVLFNRSKILKHEKDVSINKPYHFGIHKAAKTLVERLKWRQALPSNLLILGAYNFALTEEIKTALPHFINDETIIHYDIFAFDSEYLPFQKHQFDCILSFFDIQTINDVPGYLKQIAYCLKPNGLFTGVYVGGGHLIR